MTPDQFEIKSVGELRGMTVVELRKRKGKILAILERGHFPQIPQGMNRQGDEAEKYTKKWQDGKRTAREELIVLESVLMEKGYRPSEIIKRTFGKLLK